MSTPERPLTDETLMRFADGDLPAGEHAVIAGLIASRPEERARLRAYSFTREELPRAYAKALDVPSELLTRCLPPAERRLRWSRPVWALPGWPVPAIAALAAACVGVVTASLFLQQRPEHSEFSVLFGVPPPAVVHALEATLTGEDVAVGEGVRLQPVMTFASRSGKWCRQVQFSVGNEIRADAIACRSAGTWKIAVASAERRRPLYPEAGLDYKPAGAVDAVADMRDQIIDGNILAPAEERRLIATERWQRAP
jgi:hypothetical protein